MNQEVIGSNAGLIWNALNAENGQTLKSLKKATKLKDKEIYLALGWLAREGKVKFNESDDEIMIELA
ncbi:MAG: winged helix-turn-helix domain-containing protein [Bacteroidales bacterium]